MVMIIFTWTLLSLFSCIHGGYSDYGTISGIALLAITFFVIFKKQPNFGMASLIYLASLLITSALCMYTESGVFLSEIKEFTYPTGITLKVTILCAFMMISASFIYAITGKVKFIYGCISSDINNIFKLSVKVASVFLIIILFATWVIYGSPNSHGVDRFYYWEHIAPKWAQYCKFVLEQMSIFLGILYAQGKRKVFMTLMILSLVSQVMVGEKFTGLYLSIFLFFTPYVFLYRKNAFKMLFNARAVVLAILAVMSLAITSYLSYASMSGGDAAIAKLLNRVVLQAQMWWAVGNYEGSGFGIGMVMTHLFGFGASETDSGIRYLMGIISPPDVYSWFMDRGVTFTMGGPVNLIYFFGFPGSILASIIVGALIGIGMRVFYDSIMSTDFVLIFLSVKLFYAILRISVMGETQLILEPKTILYLVLFIAYSLMSALLYRKGINSIAQPR